MASKFEAERLKGIVVPVIAPVANARDGAIDDARHREQADYVIERVVAGKDTVVFPARCCGEAGAVCSTSNKYPEPASGAVPEGMRAAMREGGYLS